MLYHYFKNKFVNILQVSLSKVKNKSNYIIKASCADGEREFLSINCKTFYKKRNIIFKYTILYIYKENNLGEKRKQIIITIKDLLLIDNRFSTNFWAKTIDTVNYF